MHKDPAIKTALLNRTLTTNKETVQSVLERVMAVHTVTTANRDMTGIFVEIDSASTNFKLQPPLNSVVKPPSDMTSKIERALPDIEILTKTKVDQTVENCLTKCTKTLQSSIFKAFKSTLGTH